MSCLVALTLSACGRAGFGADAGPTRATADPGPDLGSTQLLDHYLSGQTGGGTTSSPVTAGGSAFVTTTAGKLDAFTIVVGVTTPGCSWNAICSPRWSAALGAPSHSTPAVENGVVYAASDDGSARAFDAAGQRNCGGAPTSCAPLWRTSPVGAIVSSLQVVNDTLYVGSTDGTLYAYDARGSTNCAAGECSPLWSASTRGPIRSSPAVSNGAVFVGSTDGRLYAYDARGSTNCAAGVCSPLWSASTGAPIRSSPVVAGRVVYIGSDDGTLRAFDAAGTTNCSGAPTLCTPLWSATTAGAIVATPAIADGRVVVGSDDANLRAYDAAGQIGCSGTPRTCEPLWLAPMGGAVRGSPAIADHVVYASATDGALTAFDLAGTRQCSGAPLVCAPLWSTTLTPTVSAPAIGQGRLFVGADGFHAYRVVVTPASPGLSSATLTSDQSDTYGVALGFGGHASSHANLTNVGGNSRVTFARTSDGAGTNVRSCATWTSDAGSHDQEGAALRVHSVSGGVKAITVTKNVVFGATWIFNVHVWDTSRSPVATQIASFDLSPIFYPNHQLVPLPWTLCAQVVGSILSFTAWPSSSPQPATNDPSHGGSVTLPAGYSDPGTAGFYIGHLQPDERAEFSNLLAGPMITSSDPISTPTTTPRTPTAIPDLP